MINEKNSIPLINDHVHNNLDLLKQAYADFLKTYQELKHYDRILESLRSQDYVSIKDVLYVLIILGKKE